MTQRWKLDQLERPLELRRLNEYPGRREEGVEAFDLLMINHDGGDIVAENKWTIDHGVARIALHQTAGFCRKHAGAWHALLTKGPKKCWALTQKLSVTI